MKTTETKQQSNLSSVQIKSQANQFLKLKHNSINSVLRTIQENFDSIAMQRLINDLQATETSKGRQKISVKLDINDFEYNNVISLLMFYTDIDGKKIFSKLTKLTDKIEPTLTFGAYSVQSGVVTEITEKQAKNGFKVTFNNTHTLVPIYDFSIWYILTIVIKNARLDALNGARAVKLFNREIKAFAKRNNLDINLLSGYCDTNKIDTIEKLNSIPEKDLKPLLFVKPEKAKSPKK